MKHYRADIDGLRAIAVLLVLFFHIDWLVFQAGFIGVDVFFTISGFLITSILLKDINRESFTFLGFYKKRAFRLLPAYLFMLIIALCVFYFILGPLAYQDLLASGFASTIFASNFYFFFHHGGYFSTLVTELPLLHTWSLAVEEQFYLLIPVFLLLWVRVFKQKAAMFVFGCFFLLSVFVSYYLTNLNQSAAYFLLFARIHELLLGAMLAVFLFKKPEHKPALWFANTLFVISIIAIIAVALLLESKQVFPGLIALIPCLACVAVLYAGTNTKCLSHSVLGLPVFVKIGLISYSLYLWHWPIVAGLKYIGIEFTLLVQLAIIASSFLMAFISYRFVETKVRYSKLANSNKAMLAIYILPVALLLGLYYVAPSISNNANPQFVEAEKAHRSKPNELRGKCHSAHIQSEQECVLGDNNATKLNAILWGDSHANHFAPFVDEVLLSNKQKGMDITMGSCPPVLYFEHTPKFISEACILKNQGAIELIESSDAPVIYLAGSWYGYSLAGSKKAFSKERLELVLKGLTNTLDKLSNTNKQVVVFDTLARLPQDISACSLKALKFGKDVENPECVFQPNVEQFEVSKSVNELLSRYSNVKVIDINRLICEQGSCKTVISGIPVYRDSNHLNVVSAKKLAALYLLDKNTN